MANQPVNLDELLAYSVPTFSKVSSLGTTLIREEIHAGNLPARMCRGRYLITRPDALNYLANLPEATKQAAA